jgi:hypothetical protein
MVKAQHQFWANNKKVHFMKYTFNSLVTAAALSMAALLFSFSNADARNLPQNVGSVLCNINYDHTVVRKRVFVNYVQIYQQDLPIFDEGFGIQKDIDLAANNCRATAIQLCTPNGQGPSFVPLGTTSASGNIFHAPFNWTCGQ